MPPAEERYAIFLEFSYRQANIKTHVSTARSPVAYVYAVSNPRGSKVSQIVAFSAASDGKLKPGAGSHFQDKVTSIAVNENTFLAQPRTDFTLPDSKSNPMAHSDGSDRPTSFYITRTTVELLVPWH